MDDLRLCRQAVLSCCIKNCKDLGYLQNRHRKLFQRCTGTYNKSMSRVSKFVEIVGDYVEKEQCSLTGFNFFYAFVTSILLMSANCTYLLRLLVYLSY